MATILNFAIMRYIGHIVWIQCVSICYFVWIRLTDFKKLWIQFDPYWGQVLKSIYKLVCRFKSLHCANPHWTCLILTTNHTWGKIRSNFDLSVKGQICITPLRACFRVKLLGCANFCPNRASQNVNFLPNPSVILIMQ